MGTQQFCLKWNNHQLNMLSVFDHLLQNEAFVDVTLACEGLSLKAHKMVLSACSPYFQNLFMENPCQHPIVILKDIQYNDMKSIIDFMYKGEVNVSQEQLNALLKTADTLKVKGLAEVSGQVTQSPIAETSSQQTQPQQIIPVPSKSPTLKRKRRHGHPPSPSAINTLHSNSSSSSSSSSQQQHPQVQSVVSLSSKNNYSSDDSVESRQLSKVNNGDDASFESVNDLVVAQLKEERLEENSNDVNNLLLNSQDHIDIDPDPSNMQYSNDGMDQENVSPMRNDNNYSHSVSIPSTSQTGSNLDAYYQSVDHQRKYVSSSANSTYWGNDIDASSSPAEPELISMEELFENEVETRGKLVEFVSLERMHALENIKTSGKLVNNLMNALFTKDELAKSSVTGKKSPRSLEAKKALDPLRANLVIAFTHHKFPGESMVTIKQKMAQKCQCERLKRRGYE